MLPLIDKYKNRPALSLVDGNTNTYSQVYEKAKLVANALSKLGIEKKSNVGILASGMPEWGISYFGIVCYERIAVPMLTEFSLSELITIFEHSQQSAIFIEKKLIKKFENELDKFPPVIIQMEDFRIVKGPDSFVGKTIFDFDEDVNLFMNAEEDDIASINYTLGTTGRSKGVMLTHKNLVWMAVLEFADFSHT